tara:strand:+ start:502 stop:681 length:180 start_codon:yes stop_codon:yes gene_type:complete
MGYQNNSRPKKKLDLLIDISFDLSDLLHDIDRGIDKDSLAENIKFIKKTVNKLGKKISK